MMGVRTLLASCALLAVGFFTGCSSEPISIDHVEVRPPAWQVAPSAHVPLRVRSTDLGKIQDIVREVAEDHGFRRDEFERFSTSYVTGKEHPRLYSLSVTDPRPTDRVVVVVLYECGDINLFWRTRFFRKVRSDLLRRLRSVFGEENVVVK